MSIQISSIVTDLHDADVAMEQIELYFKSRTPEQEAADNKSGATRLIAQSNQIIERLKSVIDRLEV